MPADFLFTIDLADEPASDRVLSDLATAVFAYAGLAPSTTDGLSRELRQALAGGAGREPGRCRVRFQAAAGTLTVGVARGDGPEWQATHPLP